MRKIYSLVLLAAMLLVGTNVWAYNSVWTNNLDASQLQGESYEASVTINGVTKYARNLYDAFNAVDYDGNAAKITLLKNVIDLTKSIVIYLPYEHRNDSPKNIELDMNNCTIQSAEAGLPSGTGDTKYTSGAHTPFILFRGTLNITGTGSIVNRFNGGFDTSSSKPKWTATGIAVIGSPNEEDADFSNLTIGSGVTVTGKQEGVTVYITSGQDEYTGITTATTDGNLGYNCSTAGYGINIKIYGTVSGEVYGMNFTGNIKPKPDAGEDLATTTKKYPKIYIDQSATIYSGCDTLSNGKTKTGIYSSGWGIWKIKGTVYGATGVFIKGGNVTFDDATISSCYTGTHVAVTQSGSGAAGAGSAITVNSSAGGYTGGISVNIEGDTKVSATNGYAIEEKITTQNGETKVTNITIDGGTFEGGQIPVDPANPDGATKQATIIVTNTTASNATVTVNGGNVTGSNVSQTDDGVTIGGQSLADYLSTQGTETHITYVDDGKGGTTMVVSGGSAPTGVTDWATVGDGENENVNYTGTAAITIGNGTDPTTKTLGELQLISGTSGNEQALTVNNKATLIVKRLILNSYARITVEAGGKLIVRGDQGINAPVSENIVLKSTATSQATFVIAPEVTSNKQPKATIELYTTAYSTTGNWKWQRFTSPVVEATAPTVTPTAITYVSYLNPVSKEWEDLTSWSQLKPFAACAITNTTQSGVKYTFTGNIMGNETKDLKLQDAKWNYYGNSFTAPISTKALLNAFAGQPIDQIIYFWKLGKQKYDFVNLAMYENFTVDNNEIPAMGFFAIKNLNAAAGSMNINYANSVYGYALNPTGADYNHIDAPARGYSVSNKLRISLQSESGISDKVYVIENDQYSASYDNGADAEKLMNEDMNIYVVEDEMNYAMLATDGILGTLISIQTAEDINYTLTFDNVGGEVYALRDNLTNTVVLMSEGASYNFTAQPNTMFEGRFQIVNRQEMPTAVETVEEMVNSPKAIYTIMGQYVGETTDWNNLPAGVYVVDGVKIVK